MSHEAVTWAMKDAPMLRTEAGKPDHTARHVLQVLAEYAEKDGTEARPSIPSIRYRTGMDRSTVQRALRRLEVGKLIEPRGVVNGAVNYALAMDRIRPASDWEEIREEEERRKADAAERKRKSRANAVTDSAPVTVTHSEGVTEASNDADVTDSAPGRHALKVCDNPNVTDSAPGRHTLNAAEPSLDPSLKEDPSTNPCASGDEMPGQTCLIEAAAEADTAKPRGAAKKKPPAKPKKPNKHQIADDLAAAFWEHHKANCAQSFLAVRGVVRTAISNGRNRDDCARALDALAREGRAISGGTLQTALAQLAQPHRPHLKAVAGGLSQDQWDAAMDRARARDAAASSREIT